MDTDLKRSKSELFPANLLPSLRGVFFVCPLCHKNLEILTDGYRCRECQRNYLLHAGIPDFRVFPDPYLTLEEDRERTEIVLKALDTHKLEELLKYYWSYSDITPEALSAEFIKSAMRGEGRAKRTIEIFEDGSFDKKIGGETVLEIGSGTGNFLIAATGKYRQVIGSDIAMRWLHVSRRRFMDRGLPVPALVCCCAEFLPFADDSFDLVTSTSTLEFVKDQAKALAECSRVVRDDGSVHFNSANRFSLAKDPYARLWGVGFLPRGRQQEYVRRRQNATYKARNLSYRQLNRMARADFAFKKDALPDIDSATLAELPAAHRLQVRVYRRLKELPVFSHLLKWLGPGWDIVLRKRPF